MSRKGLIKKHKMNKCNNSVYVTPQEFFDLPKIVFPKVSKTYNPYEDNGGSIFDSPFAERKRESRVANGG